MSRLLTPIMILVLALAAFLALFPLATLDIANPGWLIRGTDNGENALGLHAYLHDAAAGWSLHTTLLNAPEGVPLLFTDSNPLLGAILKPFAHYLPADAQFVGPWILACFVLQAVFAWLLLRRHAPNPLALWLGVAFLAFPPTLANRFIHANLMAHWVILAALWLYLDPVRGVRLRWWLALIALTALIHSYLLVMVGAIWASGMLTRLTRNSYRDPAWLGQGAAILLAVGALAWWLGVAGDFAPAGNYGAFSMSLDALWNAGIDSYSNFLPASERSPGRGFEGFQYIGLGSLLLLAVAAFAGWRFAPQADEARIHQRLRGLVPALVVLTILAIARLPLPESALSALDAVRASGRLFWPVGYTLMLVVILAVYRLPGDRPGLVLTGLLAVQLADISGMAQAIHATSAAAPMRHRFVRTVDPRWDQLVAASRSIAFVPGDVTKDLSLFQEIAWRAVAAGRPVTSVYAARTPRSSSARLAREEVAFANGELLADRLYVLLPTAPLPFAANPRLLTIDGVVVIRPVSAFAPPPAP